MARWDQYWIPRAQWQLNGEDGSQIPDAINPNEYRSFPPAAAFRPSQTALFSRFPGRKSGARLKMAEKRRGRAEKRATTAGYFPPAGALNFFTTPPSGDSFVRPRARFVNEY